MEWDAALASNVFSFKNPLLVDRDVLSFCQCLQGTPLLCAFRIHICIAIPLGAAKSMACQNKIFKTIRLKAFCGSRLSLKIQDVGKGG